MDNNLQGINQKLKALGIYQIAGGAIGIALTLYIFVAADSLAALLLFIFLVIFGLYGYSIYCGVTLLKNQFRGLQLSKINQIVQVIGFTGLGYSYQYVSGVYFSPGLDLTDSFSLKLNLGLSTWRININSREQDMIVTLNLVALFLIFFIDKTLKKMKARDIQEELSHLGQTEEASS